jgi:hypothetical protein
MNHIATFMLKLAKHRHMIHEDKQTELLSDLTY